MNNPKIRKINCKRCNAELEARHPAVKYCEECSKLRTHEYNSEYWHNHKPGRSCAFCNNQITGRKKYCNSCNVQVRLEQQRRYAEVRKVVVFCKVCNKIITDPGSGRRKYHIACRPQKPVRKCRGCDNLVDVRYKRYCSKCRGSIQVRVDRWLSASDEEKLKALNEFSAALLEQDRDVPFIERKLIIRQLAMREARERAESNKFKEYLRCCRRCGKYYHTTGWGRRSSSKVCDDCKLSPSQNPQNTKRFERFVATRNRTANISRILKEAKEKGLTIAVI